MKLGKIDTWESRPLEKLKDTSKLPGSKYCTQRSSSHYIPATSTNITHYYLWFPADLCYSWVYIYLHIYIYIYMSVRARVCTYVIIIQITILLC